MESYIAVILCSHYTDDVDRDEKEEGGNNVDDTVDLILYLLDVLATCHTTWHIRVMSISLYFTYLAFESGQKLSNVTVL
jgi:hypothetical protein